MKNIINTIKQELTLKIDFINNEFELGWFWIIIQLPSLYSLIKYIATTLINTL